MRRWDIGDSREVDEWNEVEVGEPEQVDCRWPSARVIETMGRDITGQAEELLPEVPSPSCPEGHLVPAAVLQNTDNSIARHVAEGDSRIVDRELTEADLKILKGDAGEGRAYVDLLRRYDRELILHQPRIAAQGRWVQPDFAVLDQADGRKLLEIADAKAWTLLKPGKGECRESTRFLEYLQGQPEPERLLHIQAIRETVEKYARVPELASDGRVVIYLPEDVVRHAPQVVERIESWSQTTVACERGVEVRSMGVWEQDLWEDVSRRRKQKG